MAAHGSVVALLVLAANALTRTLSAFSTNSGKLLAKSNLLAKIWTLLCSGYKDIYLASVCPSRTFGTYYWPAADMSWRCKSPSRPRVRHS